MKTQWYLLRREVPKGSLGKNWLEQLLVLAELPKEEKERIQREIRTFDHLEGRAWDVATQDIEARLRAALKDYEVPLTIAEVVKSSLDHKKSDRFPNKDVYARCDDLASDGYRVYVGNFKPDGLHVNSYWGYYRIDYIGLSASRKFKK